MDVQAYIQSGILEQYCLGLLNDDERADVLTNCNRYPEIKQELANIESAIEKMAHKQAVIPNESLKQKILSTLGFSDKIDLNNPPLINAETDYTTWLEAVAHLMPENPFDNSVFKVLKDDDHLTQTFVVTQNGVSEEIHDNLLESFLILKGQCVCNVGNSIVTLHSGDFLEIPLNTPHDVTITSPYVVAILQEIKV